LVLAATLKTHHNAPMRRAFFLIALLFSTPAFAADEAQGVYSRHAGAVYQVQTIDVPTGRKSGIGSGFQFTPDGLMATNYHVIASAVRHPDVTRLEFLQDKTGKGALTVVAVDVMNDLAILKMDRPGRALLSLGSSALPKGARLFSLGNPHDIGFTIVEGTYNGLAHESFADRIHFSGALNPGMSGGPALSHNGRVVGINVATGGNQIGFLVPVEPLKVLAQQAENAKGDFIATARDTLESQLLAGQERIVRALLDSKWDSAPFGPFMVPGRIHEALKCWGSPMHQDKDPYLFHRSVCGTQDRVFLDEDFDTGVYAYRYDHITPKAGMDRLRFKAFYEQQYATPAGKTEGGEDDLTNFSCETGFTALAGRKWTTSFCVRRYKAYPALWDMRLYMALVDSGSEGMITAFGAEGVSRPNALLLAKRFMSEIRPKAGAKP
jgi:serine protease Do